MANILQQVAQIIKKDVTEKLSVLKFEYNFDDDCVEVTADASYNNPDCDFIMGLIVWCDSGCSFWSSFGEIEESVQTLKLVNSYNSNNGPFRAYIDENTSNLCMDFDITYNMIDDISMFDHLYSGIVETLIREIQTPEMRRLLSYISD